MLALAAVRAIHFAFAIQEIGALLFIFIIGRLPGLAGNATGHSPRRWLMMSAVVSAVAIIPSGFAWLMLQAAGMTGHTVTEAWDDGTVLLLLFKTHAGTVWWVRLGIAVALLIDLCVLALPRRVASEAAVFAGLVLAIANFVSCAWLSHAAADASPYASLHLATHALHMLAVSVWLGGLIPLAIVVSSEWYTGDKDAATAVATAAVIFGNIALIAVGTIIVSGVANTALVVTDVSELTAGTYAKLLAIKIVLFFFMLVLAAQNRLRLVPRLAHSNDRPAATQLCWSILGELVLGLMILMAAGALGVTAPGVDD